MELILQDIQRALDAGASYAALAAAVTLPEMCGRCEQQDIYSTSGRNNAKHVFERFVSAYLANWEIGLTGADLYNLRNGLSHRGQATQRNKTLRYVFFPPVAGATVNNNRRTVNGEIVRLNIDLRKFCHDISNAVRQWMANNAGNTVVQKNLENILQSREGDFGTGVLIRGVHYLA